MSTAFEYSLFNQFFYRALPLVGALQKVKNQNELPIVFVSLFSFGRRKKTLSCFSQFADQMGLILNLT